MKYKNLSDFLDYVKARDPHQPEFHQAVQEVMGSLWAFIKANPHYADSGILERLVESERIIQFRVSWVD
ncbi:MAG: glutamate dehydrogenase, partial [Rhodoferax sp.]|nr:glutamate dehydrogenase [Rhodoferax sp.]